jgi:hypothetical protein
LYFAFGIFSPYNYFTAKRDVWRGKFQIVTIGLAAYPRFGQMISAKYDFRIRNLGCNVTAVKRNGTYYYNTVMRQALCQKYGDSFWQQFALEVDSVKKSRGY